MAGCASRSGIAPSLTPTSATTLDPGAAIRAAVSDANAQAQWPSLAWWQIYADPQLDRLVSAAIADNPSQAVAAARLREALAMAGAAHAATLPTLDATASLNRRHWTEGGYYSGGFGGKNTFDNTGLLHFAYPLDVYGGARSADEQALDAAHAAAAEVRSAQLTLESNVVRAYIQLSLQYALRDVAQQTLADQQHILDLANRRFKAGLATQLEVSEAEAPLPETALSLEQIDVSIALSGNQLAALSGQAPGAAAAIVRPALRFDAPVTLPSALPAELIGHRPDVVAQRWRVEAQARSIDVAKAAFYPNINLVASGGGSAVGAVFSTFTRLSSMGFTAGPAISLPIFEGGRLRAGLGAAAANYDIAVAQYNGAVLGALHEISDNLLSFESLRRQQDEAARSVSTAQRSYDLALSGFQRGLTDYLNVLTAQTRLLQQQQSVKRVEAARFSAYAELMTALGGGLATPEDSPVSKPPSILPVTVGARE
jgi:NodT family efflux transporter outer membrane factor (OMF) lipoprotein